MTSTHPARSPLTDAIALTRPTLLVPLWTMHLLGYLHAHGAAGDWRLFRLPTAGFLFLSGLHTLLMGAVYIVNQIADAPSDARNRKLFLIAEGRISRRFLWIEVVLLLTPTFGVSVYHALSGSFGSAFEFLFGGSLLLGLAYSLPPFRLKARAGWDLLANSVGYGAIAFAVGWVAVAPLSAETWLQAIPYVCSVAATFAFTTIPDIPGDGDAGFATLGVRLGPVRTGWVGVGCLVVGCVAGFSVRNYPSLIALIVALPLYGKVAWRLRKRGDDVTLTRATQVVILMLSFVAAVGVPLYFGWLAGVLLWVRRYYRRRFGIKYP